MIIIPKEPFKTDTFDTVAVNILTYDHLDIRKLENNTFQLAAKKFFDGHFSNHSTIYTTIAIFKTYDECMDLFNQLIEAMKSGEQVFDLREIEIPSQLQSADIPHV